MKRVLVLATAVAALPMPAAPASAGLLDGCGDRALERPFLRFLAGAWLPTLPSLFLEKALQVLSLDGLPTQVRFRFTPTNILLGSAKWRIDDVYVDPLEGLVT